MIIRIMGEGQWEVPESALTELNLIDSHVEHAVNNGGQAELTEALTRLAATVREHGRQIPDDEIVDSDLIVPDTSATVDEVSQLLDGTAAGDGLIPG